MPFLSRSQRRVRCESNDVGRPLPRELTYSPTAEDDYDDHVEMDDSEYADYEEQATSRAALGEYGITKQLHYPTQDLVRKKAFGVHQTESAEKVEDRTTDKLDGRSQRTQTCSQISSIHSVRTIEHQIDGAVSDAEDAVQNSKDGARETGREIFLYPHCISPFSLDVTEMHLRDGVDVEGDTAEQTDHGIQTRSRNRTNNLLRKTVVTRAHQKKSAVDVEEGNAEGAESHSRRAQTRSQKVQAGKIALTGVHQTESAEKVEDRTTDKLDGRSQRTQIRSQKSSIHSVRTIEHQIDGAVSDAEDAVDSHFQGVKTRPHNSSKDGARETGRELFLYCYSLTVSHHSLWA
ncbi:hypothetical protein GBAR_LOCUS12030 [Geodia barretti]|uniref:Uncharacterized protein n=1 Tax=Geodia barretti TaxID=519541 RepID=A0AA35RYI2_GEOBA|nr:hypothetical protein GBAR_LOCUS12030 [Geodia barretti]